MGVSLALVLLALLASSAKAANAPDPRLDAAASEVVGRTVYVHCETDATTWAELARTIGGLTTPPEGFSSYSGATIWLSPEICLTLRYALRADAPALPLRLTGAALLTLIHEATHLRGVVDEGETDCIALALVRRYAISLLGVPERVSRFKFVTRYKRVRVNGRWVRRRVKVRVRVLVPNPRLDAIVFEARAAHRTLPAPYNAECGVTP